MHFSKKVLHRALLVGAAFAITMSIAHPAQASWFGRDFFAASFFSSLWEKIILPVIGPPARDPGDSKSSGTDTNEERQPPAITAIQASCIPPVPGKPGNLDVGSAHGSVTVTPEVSTAGPDNIITISLNSDLEEVNSVSIYIPFPADLDDYVVDWYPKKAPDVSFSQANYSGNGKFHWGLSSITGKYQKYNYGVRIRMQDATIQKQAKNATNADGWRKISYTVSGLKPGRIPAVEKGSKGFYVGREQEPSLITTIGKDNFKDTFYSGSPSLKPFTVVPNGYFEIQTKSLGQPGTIAMVLKNGKVVGDAERAVRADETITWKIQPLTNAPVQLRELSLTNNCGKDYFIDPAKSSRLSDLDQFMFPVEYQFSTLTTKDLDVTLGIRGQNLSLTAGSKEFVHLKAPLWTQGDTKVPVPAIPITFRAVYADNRSEIVKNAIFKTYAADEKEYPGEITERTIREANNAAVGSALVRISAHRMTAADAKRGIVIQTTSDAFPGLAAEMTIPLGVPRRELESKPESPTHTDVRAKNLLITSDTQLEMLQEGDRVSFKAMLLMSDGSKRPAGRVSWTVIGKIGSIDAGGMFTAKLDESIAEEGEARGIVTAIYKDADGNALLGKTPTFKVEAFAPDEGGGPDSG